MGKKGGEGEKVRRFEEGIVPFGRLASETLSNDTGQFEGEGCYCRCSKRKEREKCTRGDSGSNEMRRNYQKTLTTSVHGFCLGRGAAKGKKGKNRS